MSSTNYRNPINPEPRIFGNPYPMHTPAGTVYTTQIAPPVPPRPYQSQSNYMNSSYGMGGGMYNSYGGYGYGGGYGMFGNSMYGGGYGRYGYGNTMGPENRFIQMAEQSTRPAFESIESLVGAVGNIATMLDSTLFAFTSSFRAILGVAANFGHLRTVFAQFWSTFALFRGLNWLIKKILYTLRISKYDPKSVAFNEIFSAATAGENLPIKQTSSWPIFIFLSFIFAAPYLIMKLINSVTNSVNDESKNPMKWINPIKARALYNFDARNQEELSIRAGQTIYMAPKEVQTALGLINTGWAIATVDNQISGMIPINYVQNPRTMEQIPAIEKMEVINEPINNTSSSVQSEPEQINITDLNPS